MATDFQVPCTVRKSTAENAESLISVAAEKYADIFYRDVPINLDVEYSSENDFV